MVTMCALLVRIAIHVMRIAWGELAVCEVIKYSFFLSCYAQVHAHVIANASLVMESVLTLQTGDVSVLASILDQLALKV